MPVIPFPEVVGKEGIDSPEQYGPGVVNVGNKFGLIVIVIVIDCAH